jgi:DNA mismatch repair ATPase MutS
MLALACHVEGRTVCAAATGPLALQGVAHPLLAHALPATVTLHGKGLFVTGRNGEGKSTLLRTVGLNLLVGRALGFCYAEQASVPALPLYCSLQNEDSLLDGESLFISELRRGREMLDAGDGVFVIDEIFRGTNHVDSVAAAAALVEELSQRGIVLVSSHNVILGALLRHRLDAVCVTRADAELVLAPGVLVETNALALLGEHGLGASVQASARRVAQWLQGYLARPADAERVLVAN